MAMKDQCKQAVAQALGKQSLTAQEAANIEARINETMRNMARRDVQKWRNLSQNEKLSEASKQVAIDIKEQLARKHKIAANNIVTLSQRFNDLDHKNLPANQVLDRMVAPYGDMSGITPIELEYKSIADMHKSELDDFYTNINGWTKLITDQELVTKVVKELFKEKTDDTMAKNIAEKIREVNNNLKDRFNRSGGDIGDLGDKYGLPTHWGRDKFSDDRKGLWLDLAQKNIDPDFLIKSDGSTMTQLELQDVLSKAFDTISSDGLNSVEVGKMSYSGASNVTNRMSQSRVLHWKDADAWLEMQREFGELPLFEIVNSHIDTMAKNIALVEKFGSNPNTTFKILAQEAKRIDQKNGINNGKISRGINRAQTMYDVFSGNGIKVESEILADIGSTYRAVNTGGLLGSALLSSLSDIAPMVKMAKVHGISTKNLFSELTKTLNPKNKEHRKFARSLALGIDEMTGSVARWGADSLTDLHSRSSKIARGSQSVASTVLRLSLLNAWSAGAKQAWSKLLMNKYAEVIKEKSWLDLTDSDRNLMKNTGLDEQTWEVMRLAKSIEDMDGNPILSSKSVYEIPDELLTKFGDPKKIKDHVATKYHAHILNEQGFAVIESGLREQTRIFGTTTGGDLAGFLLRGFWQFKSFPTAFLMRHGSRMLAQPTIQGKAFYGIGIAMGMSILGGLSLQLGEIALGNDPLEIWDSNDPKVAMDFFFRSVAKGGGLSIMGDVFAAGADPSGRDARNMLIGPLGNDFAQIAKITAGTANKWYNNKDMTNTPNEIYRLLKSKVPAQNLWYTKAAINKLMFDHLQDTIAPGYREKLMKKAEQEQKKRSFLGDFSYSSGFDEARSPDFERTIK